MSNEEDDKIRSRIQEIFPSPQHAAAIVDIVVHGKKPAGWGRHSRATYYDEEYATPIKKNIDRMMENKQRMVYRYDRWCTDETGMSTSTLYALINQAIRYICERMDPEDVYK